MEEMKRHENAALAMERARARRKEEEEQQRLRLLCGIMEKSIEEGVLKGHRQHMVLNDREMNDAISHVVTARCFILSLRNGVDISSSSSRCIARHVHSTCSYTTQIELEGVCCFYCSAN